MQNFDFNVTREEKKNGNDRKKNIRIILLFCVVAAVTALVIYLIIPKKDDPANAETQNTAEQTTQNDSAADAPGTAENGQAQTQNSAVPAEKPAVSGNDAPASSPGKEKSAALKNTVPVNRSGAAKYDPAIEELKRQTVKFRKALTNESWKDPKYTVTHSVVHGDYLSTLCKKYHNPRAFVMHYNNIAQANNISLGQKITFIKADKWQVTISRKNGFLKIDRIVGKEVIPFAAFDCHIRDKGVTRSDLVICTRDKNPKFQDRHGRVIDPGAEENPYGEFRITLARSDRPDKAILPLSIHGKGGATAVETSVKDGATVLSPEDILLFYQLIPEGTPVSIIE
ncbi:MAG: LysM peptidoglycan-binding domain-containing protein [Lentisphaeria bacterium]|nr:LysM peptidoglycan-binding domain-containing protein [Lentisphaeria bacterium]